MLASLATSTASFAFQESDDQTRIEFTLESAYENLNEAGTYVCRDSRAQREYRPVWADFTKQMEEAASLLKRQPRTAVFVNSCRRRVNWSKFRRALKFARLSLSETRKMLDLGKSD